MSNWTKFLQVYCQSFMVLRHRPNYTWVSLERDKHCWEGSELGGLWSWKQAFLILHEFSFEALLASSMNSCVMRNWIAWTAQSCSRFPRCWLPFLVLLYLIYLPPIILWWLKLLRLCVYINLDFVSSFRFETLQVCRLSYADKNHYHWNIRWPSVFQRISTVACCYRTCFSYCQLFSIKCRRTEERKWNWGKCKEIGWNACF